MTQSPNEVATRILLDYQLRPVVNLDKIIEANKLELVERKMEDAVSGMCVIKNGKGYIVVNSAHSQHRKRFTIAHELGHYFLNGGKDSTFIDRIYFRSGPSTLRDKEEIDANSFAAELLMPESAIREYVAAHPFDILDEGNLREATKHFDVSEQALTIRLANLRLIANLPAFR